MPAAVSTKYSELKQNLKINMFKNSFQMEPILFINNSIKLYSLTHSLKSKISNLALHNTELLTYQSFQSECRYVLENVGGRRNIRISA